jgi:hypothetical protein
VSGDDRRNRQAHEDNMDAKVGHEKNQSVGSDACSAGVVCG